MMRPSEACPAALLAPLHATEPCKYRFNVRFKSNLNVTTHWLTLTGSQPQCGPLRSVQHPSRIKLLLHRFASLPVEEAAHSEGQVLTHMLPDIDPSAVHRSGIPSTFRT